MTDVRLLLIGIALLGGATVTYAVKRSFVAHSIVVPGVVTDLDCHIDEDGDELCDPQITFLALDGTSHTFETGVSSNVHPSIGEPQEVYYDVVDPGNADTGGTFGLWLWPFLLLVGGVASVGWHWVQMSETEPWVRHSGRPVVRAAALAAGLALFWLSYYLAGADAPGTGALPLLLAGLIVGGVLLFALHDFELRGLANGGLGFSALLVGLLLVVGAWALPSGALRAGWIVGACFAGLVTAPMQCLLWWRVEAAFRERGELRDEGALTRARIEEALAGSDRCLLVRIDELAQPLRATMRCLDGDTTLAVSEGLIHDVRVGFWYLLVEPRWADRAVFGGASYRDVDTERTLAAASTVLYLGASFADELRPPALALGGARWAGLAPLLLLTLGIAWAWDLPEPIARHIGHPRPTEVTRMVATVYRTVGEAPVEVGEECEIELGPAESGVFNCLARVQCGDRVLYGDAASGYTFCVVQEGRAITARDVSDIEGDPQLIIDVGDGRAQLAEWTDREYTIVLTFLLE